MTDPLDSPRRKLARAKQHLTNLDRMISDFSLRRPYKRVIEQDAKEPDHQVHKVKLTDALPDSLPETTGDVVQNLRSALDHAAYALAVASGRTDPKFAAFPFAGNVAQMASALGRSRDVPAEIQSLFCGFQPYRGGDDLLWALNAICVSDKHKILTAIGVGAVRAKASVKGTGFFRMPDPHVWDREKNEMVLLTVGPPGNFDYDFDFTLFVAFTDIPVVDGLSVVEVLDSLANKVESILNGIEAEARRLGLIS